MSFQTGRAAAADRGDPFDPHPIPYFHRGTLSRRTHFDNGSDAFVPANLARLRGMR